MVKYLRKRLRNLGGSVNPTIKDVAKKAGVSVATVSRVINNLGGYNTETGDRVLKVISDLGYFPNAVARGLVGKHTKTVGVLIPDMSSLVSARMLAGLEDAAQEEGFSVIVCNTLRDGERTMDYLDVLREKQAEGIIIMSELLKESYSKAIREIGIPVTLISTYDSLGYFPSVKVNDFQASYDAVRFLIDKGHTRIAFISGTFNDWVAGKPRADGWAKALSDANIPVNPDYLKEGDFRYESGIALGEELLSLEKLPTAVLAASDEMAAGFLTAARKKGISVPDAVSVMGYDDTNIAEMLNPALTCLRQPFYEMGYEGMKMLIMGMEGKKTSSKLIQHTITERDSVKEIK